MASIKLFFDTRRVKKDGTYPLKLKLFHENAARYIPLQYSLKKNQWKNQDCKVQPSYPNSGRLNARIHKLLFQASTFLVEHQDELEALHIDELKSRITKIIFSDGKIKTGKEKPIFLFEYFQELIKRLERTKRYGSASAYRTALNSIINYLDGKDIPLNKVDYNFLTLYQEDCKARGLKINSIGVYLRTLRAVINKAIDEGKLPQENYPFRKFRIEKESTKKRAISKADMEKILSIELEKDTPLWHAQNYFAFMFYMRGMNFIDLVFLKEESIQGNRIVYQRIKTRKFYNLKLTRKASEILDFYIKRKDQSRSYYIFPIIPEEVQGSEELERKKYIDKRKQFNKALRKLADLVGLDVNLTSYVSRHSWASIAKFSGVAPAIIGESLGHSDLKTTETYLANFDHRVLDEANELVVG